MKISKEEQEVNISFDYLCTNATIYTTYPKWIRKLDSLCKEYPDTFICTKKDEVSSTYKFPKELISYPHKPRKQKELTEQEMERRRKAGDRLRAAKKAKNND